MTRIGAAGNASRTDGEVRIRGLRTVFLLVLGIGLGGLALAAAFEIFRAPFALFVFVLATLLGLVGVLDRRVKLAISADGIRYGRWGPNVIPWIEFSGYRTATWRRNAYLQLGVRRPTQILERFSRVGRLNHFCARLLRMPAFGIAVTPLDVTPGQLERYVSRYLHRSYER